VCSFVPRQEEIVKEAQTMRQLHHPNVLTLHVSFVSKQSLWMVEPYVAGGSMLNIMKYAYREVCSRTWVRCSGTSSPVCSSI
jgi:serine/threonine protein kinase